MKHDSEATIRLLATALFLLLAFSGAPVQGATQREVELSFVNSFTRDLPGLIETSYSNHNGTRTTASYPGSEAVRVRVPALPITLNVRCAGFEDVTIQLTSPKFTVSLRPLSEIRLEIPSKGRASSGALSSVRVFVRNSHVPDLTEVPGPRVDGSEIILRLPAGKWLGAAFLNERRILGFVLNAAPAQKVRLQPASTLTTQAYRLSIADADGLAAGGAKVAWNFEQPLSVSAEAAVSTPMLPTDLTSLCADLLGRVSSGAAPGELRVPIPADARGSISIQAPGHRSASLAWDAFLDGMPKNVRLHRLPLLKVAFRPRQRDATGYVATFSPLERTSPSDPVKPASKKVPLNGSGEASLMAVVDADHRIDVRDGQGRLKGVAIVRRADNDWRQDVVSRTIQEADRLITGNVYWGTEPLPDARVIGLWLRDGVETRFDHLSPDDFTTRAESSFEVADRTDSLGRFNLYVPMAGAYRVFAYHPELRYSKSSGPVDLTDLKTADVQIRMRDHFAILDVRDAETSKPISGATAVLRSKSGKSEDPASATFRFSSDDDGLVRVGDLLAGTLEGEISAKGFRTRRLDLTPSTSFPAIPIRVEMKKAPACELLILDEAGSPVVGAKVAAIGSEATSTLFPSHLDLGASDDLGFVSTDSPSEGFPHLFVFAPGKQLKLIPYYFPAEGCGQRALVLRGREASIVPELKTESGVSLARVQVALNGSGVFLPWNLTASALASERLAGNFMETGSNGEVQVAAFLEAGLWQLYAFKKQAEGSPELQKALGSFELPLSRPTVITVRGGKR